MSNGVRELLVLAPEADIATAWNNHATKTREEAFQLPVNVVLYATGVDTFTPNIDPPVNLAAPPLRDIHIARLRVGDNWNPEPNAWPRISAVLAGDRIAVSTAIINPGVDKLDGFQIAHLTGTTRIAMTMPQRDALKKFVADGGTLLIDAAGSSAAFADSIEIELKAIFGAAAVKPLAQEMSKVDLFAPQRGLAPIAYIGYRHSHSHQFKGAWHEPRLRVMRDNGRMAVFFSREDLTAGMAGVQSDIVGYDVATATALVKDIVLYVKP